MRYCLSSVVRLIEIIFLFFSLSSVSAYERYSPLCYRNKTQTLYLLGVHHADIYVPDHDGWLRHEVSRANLVLLENVEVLPEDGKFGSKKKRLLLDNDKAFKLSEVLDNGATVELSQLFGIPLTPETAFPGSLVAKLPDAILGKKIQLISGTQQPPADPFKELNGHLSLESAAYSFALSEGKAVYGLESVNGFHHALLAPFEELKAEIRAALACTRDDQCLQDFMASETYFSDGSPRSYDEVYRAVVRIPSSLRYSLESRNRYQFTSITANLKPDTRALIVVGAAHIGGPIGLAAKFENAGFVRTKCPE